MLRAMRPLILLSTLVIVLAGFVAWRTLATDTSAPAINVDANTGVVILGLPKGAARNTASDLKVAPQKPSPKISPKTTSLSEARYQTDTPAAVIAESDKAAVQAKPVTVKPKDVEANQPPEPSYASYQVEEDDTLYRILRFAYDKANQELVDAVAEANQMEDPSELMVGQMIKLPFVDGYRKPRSK